MAEVTNDLMYELRAIHARLHRIETKMDQVKGELQGIRHHQLATSQDVGNIYVKLSRLDSQLDRIARRLELHEPAH